MDKLAEEIIDKLDKTPIPKFHELVFARYEMVKAMQAYHEAKLKEELIEYDKWLTQQYWGCEIPTPDHAVEQYLKQR